MHTPAQVGTAARWLLVGIFLLQVGWVFAIRPFGGIDEIDHAYRAASVAYGHIAPEIRRSELGRGDLILVREDIVDGAAVPCMDLPYMRLLNCHAASWPENGEVFVASAAAQYNPLYYVLVGVPAMLFEGDTALLAMRIATVLLTWALLAAAVSIAMRYASSLWPASVTLLAVTPVTLYASSTVAPNGVQLAAALLAWNAALALAQSATRGAKGLAALWRLLAIGASITLTVHSLGPGWVALSMFTLLLLPGFRNALRSQWRTDRRPLVRWGLVTTGAATLAVGWTIARGTNHKGGENAELGSLPLDELPREMVLWVLQTMVAVPFRNEHLPAHVFAILFVLFVGVIVSALARATTAERLTMALVCVLFFAVPAALSVMRYSEVGFAWQGRYTLPYAFGLLLVAGWVLDRHAPRLRLSRIWLVGAPVGFVLTQAIGILVVAHRQGQHWTVEDSTWMGLWPLWLLTLCGAGAIALAFWRITPRRHSSPTSTEPPVRARALEVSHSD